MNKLQSVKGFFSDVVAEVKKTTWPAREELMQSTVVVILSITLLGVFVSVSDKVISIIIGMLTG
jgi:preprotein translocase subunit SecE